MPRRAEGGLSCFSSPARTNQRCLILSSSHISSFFFVFVCVSAKFALSHCRRIAAVSPAASSQRANQLPMGLTLNWTRDDAAEAAAPAAAVLNMMPLVCPTPLRWQNMSERGWPASGYFFCAPARTLRGWLACCSMHERYSFGCWYLCKVPSLTVCLCAGYSDLLLPARLTA